jgi:hypothetical protein
MHAFQLCDWTTIRGISATPGQVVNQGDDQWLDLAPYQDCAFWVDCRGQSNAPTLAIQTSPTRDELYFKSMVTAITLAVGNGPTAYAALLDSALVPLARFVRWQLTGPAGSAWDATFRIFVSANSPGM